MRRSQPYPSIRDATPIAQTPRFLPNRLAPTGSTRDGMFGVRSEQKDEPFLMSVDDVFHLSGRNGTTVVGLIASGIVGTGDRVELWRNGELVATAKATIDLVCSRDIRPVQRSSITLSEIAGSDAQIGDEVRLPVG